MGKKLNDAALQEAAEVAKTTNEQKKAAKERKEALVKEENKETGGEGHSNRGN